MCFGAIYFGCGGTLLLFFPRWDHSWLRFSDSCYSQKEFYLRIVILKSVLFFFSFMCWKWSFPEAGVHVGLCLSFPSLRPLGTSWEHIFPPHIAISPTLSIWNGICPLLSERTDFKPNTWSQDQLLAFISLKFPADCWVNPLLPIFSFLLGNHHQDPACDHAVPQNMTCHPCTSHLAIRLGSGTFWGAMLFLTLRLTGPLRS